MKRDQYIPHEVSTRSNSQMMNLIEKEGMTGYGAYWALMEYLRSQDDYIGDVRALKTLARQLKVCFPRFLKILHDYDLFVCDDSTFYSPKLMELMKPLEERRARIEAYKRKKREENLLEISEEHAQENDIVEVKKKGEIKVKEKEKGKEKEERKTTSSLKEKSDADDVFVPVSSIPAWERYVDDLQHEEGWLEIMAIRSGLGKTFLQRFDDILFHFKEHVRAVAHESNIISPSEAKRYFCFYNTPGSAPFLKLMEYLKQTEVPDVFRFEHRDPVTGQRSYCGVPIPEDTPPRPNDQAVWCNGKWVY